MSVNLEEIKKDCVSQINQYVEMKTLEKSNADLLIKLISNAENPNEVISIFQLGSTYKRTGLHYDKRLEKFQGNTIKFFKKNKALSFSDGTALPHNKLIVGENYDALLNLLIEYRGKIDVIYIDPPYGKDSMGEFAKTNYDNAITRDNLLSMLHPRLLLAKQLLSPEGVIFVSIDDKNQAYIKCLMDEVFGETNFVSMVSRKTSEHVRVNALYQLQNLTDYILIYTQSKSNLVLNKKVVGEIEFNYEDENGKYYLKEFQNSGENGTRVARPNEYYPIYYNKISKTFSLEKQDDCIEILPKKVKSEDGRWLWSKKKFLKEKHLLTYKDGVIYRKCYYIEGQDILKYESYKNIFDTFLTRLGSNSLKSIGLDEKFDYSKPLELIIFLIKLIKNKNAIVLDFFAGSGTTGQAVLQANREDEGTRQFILCTSNEITQKTPNGVVLDVTSKRLKRVMTGSCYDGSTNFKWLEKNKPFGGSLDVFEIGEVANFAREKGKTPFDLIDETLYGKDKFSRAQDKIKWVCENFEITQELLKEKGESNVTRS